MYDNEEDFFNFPELPRTAPERPQRNQRPRGVTHLEYIEMSHEEMQKFKHLQPITQSDIDNVNWEELEKQIQKA